MSNNQNNDFGEDPKWDNYPVRITLCFKNEEDKKNFMADLTDGRGENMCDLDWEWRKYYKNTGKTDNFDEQTMFAVDLFDDDKDMW